MKISVSAQEKNIKLRFFPSIWKWKKHVIFRTGKKHKSMLFSYKNDGKKHQNMFHYENDGKKHIYIYIYIPFPSTHSHKGK